MATEPQTEARDSREREHREGHDGHRSWWRCMPISEAIYAEGRAKAAGDARVLAVLDRLATRVDRSLDALERKHARNPLGMAEAQLAAVLTIFEAERAKEQETPHD